MKDIGITLTVLLVLFVFFGWLAQSAFLGYVAGIDFIAILLLLIKYGLLSPNDVNAGRALELQQAKLNQSWEAAKISLGEILIPALMKLVERRENDTG